MCSTVESKAPTGSSSPISTTSTWTRLFPADAAQAFRSVLAAQLPPHPDERLFGVRHLLTEYGFEKIIPSKRVVGNHKSLKGAPLSVRLG